MQIHNAVITGSFSYNGADLSNVTSSNQSSASLSTRVTQIEQVYATTGSNSFRATQSITGSLTVTGQIIAQTLNVQQVTSSIVFSSGSNNFGCDLNSRQTFTGSVLMTGSLVVNTTGPELQVTNAGVVLGNLIADRHSVTGSFYQMGPAAGFSGSVGVGTNNPFGKFNVVAGNSLSFVVQDSGLTDTIELTNFSTVCGIRNIVLIGSVLSFTTAVAGAGSGTEKMRITSCGNVGIGTCNPQSIFHIIKGLGNDVISIGESGTNTRFAIGQEASYTGNYINSRNIDLKLQGYCAGGSGGNILFQTGTDGTGCVTTKMFLCSIGNVGIGRTDPSFILDVNDTNASGARGLRVSTSSSSAGPGLFLYINSGAQTNWLVGNSYEVGNALEFRSSNSLGGNPGSAGTTRLLVTNGGNVGIATASPTQPLQLGQVSVIAQDANSMYVGANFGTNTGGCYIKSQFSNQIHFDSAIGEINFKTAGSGTAGNSITYVSALSIKSTGQIKWADSTYMVGGTTGFRFNSSDDAFNNFVALNNGNATLRGTLTQNASDQRLKNNIQTIPNAIDKISQLRGVTFEWNKEIYETSRTTDIGVIAQDIQQVLPDAVTLAPFDTNFEDNTSKSGENYLTVYYEKIIPLLIEGIKELKAENDIFKTCLGIS